MKVRRRIVVEAERSRRETSAMFRGGRTERREAWVWESVWELVVASVARRLYWVWSALDEWLGMGFA